MKRLLLLAGILFGVSAFFYFNSRSPEAPKDFSAHLPGRDELCISNGIHLSMNSFESLKAHYTGVSSFHLVLIGLSSQWLFDTHATTGATLMDAARCIRSLFPPVVGDDELSGVNRLLKEKFGVVSHDALKTKLRDAWSGKRVEWNLSLLAEYRIEPVPSLWDKE